MPLASIKQGKREFVAVYLEYGTPDVRQYWVDVSLDNPGPIEIGGRLYGLRLGVQVMAYEKEHGVERLEDATGAHVRCYTRGYGGQMRFVGVWCPYTQAVEKAGRMFGYDHAVHYPRNGRLWCHASQDWSEVQ